MNFSKNRWMGSWKQAVRAVYVQYKRKYARINYDGKRYFLMRICW